MIIKNEQNKQRAETGKHDRKKEEDKNRKGETDTKTKRRDTLQTD